MTPEIYPFFTWSREQISFLKFCHATFVQRVALWLSNSNLRPCEQLSFCICMEMRLCFVATHNWGTFILIYALPESQETICPFSTLKQSSFRTCNLHINENLALQAFFYSGIEMKTEYSIQCRTFAIEVQHSGMLKIRKLMRKNGYKVIKSLDTDILFAKDEWVNVAATSYCDIITPFAWSTAIKWSIAKPCPCQ